jgi:NADH dehydrogenase FAD-containing subunit
MIIWTAGIAGNSMKGLILNVLQEWEDNVDSYNKVSGYSNVFALGDISLQLKKNILRDILRLHR